MASVCFDLVGDNLRKRVGRIDVSLWGDASWLGFFATMIFRDSYKITYRSNAASEDCISFYLELYIRIYDKLGGAI
jgi:hypothetical protein